MKLSYSELNDRNDISIDTEGQHVGYLRKFPISEISQNYSTYSLYLDIMTMTTAGYFERKKKLEEYDALSIDEKSKLNVFTLLSHDQEYQWMFLAALNFFFRESVQYDPTANMYITYEVKDGEPKAIGAITYTMWGEISEMIAQMNHVSIEMDEQDLSKSADERTKKVMEKLRKGRKALKKAREKTNGARMELGNLTSIIATFVNGYNYMNVYDLTVFQLYDTYNRFLMGDVYEINRMAVSVWGDKEKKFDLYARQENLTVDKNENKVSES